MINITDRQMCCGCSACAQACPKRCIKLIADNEGFLYPVVDTDVCIDCKLCEKVCPCLNEGEERKPLQVEVAYNKEEPVRMESSSGGLFSLLAESVIRKGGVVFGARFNSSWEVVHDHTDKLEDISLFRGSKYVQSRIGNAYQEVKNYLDGGTLVLFSGTPCQVYALKRFLRKEYVNLVTVDIVCHGVPSPLVWRDYLSYINPQKEEIVSVNLRDKTRSWSKYSYKIKSKDTLLLDDYAANSIYLRTFINGLSVRPSCFDCPAKGGKSQSDITLADAWGINKVYPEMNDEKGLSVVCINTEAGKKLYDSFPKEAKSFPLELLYSENPSYHFSVKETPYREKYWNLYESRGILAYDNIKAMVTPPLYKRIIQKIMRLFR